MAETLFQREKQNIYQTYKRYEIEIDKGEGAYLFDKLGNKYLDFLSGIAVNALGNSHPKIVEAIEYQAKKYTHISNYFFQEPQVELAEKLTEMTGYDKVFFSNTGAESADAAIKLSRKWGSEKGKNKLISFSGGFHGRSIGALSLMDKPLYKNGMGPFLDNCEIIEYNNIEALEKTIDEHTAAVMIEVIQGEGGINQISQEFADKLKEMQAKYEFLLVADEVQSGVGRTGKFFAFEYYELEPDIVAMAKGIGGGLPLGAILANEKTSSVWTYGMHGTTYGGNPIACSTGYVVLDELEKGLLDKVEDLGEYLHNKLLSLGERYQHIVKDVRGMGLMKGVELIPEAAKIVAELLDNHVIVNTAAGNVLRILPPLIITNDHIDEFAYKLETVFSKY